MTPVLPVPRFLIAPLVAAAFVSPPRVALAEGKNHPAGRLLLTSPAECIAVALEHNLDLDVRVFDAARADALLEAERGGFDPFAEFSADFLSREITGRNTNSGTAEGGSAMPETLSARRILDASEAIDPARASESASYGARLVQPLPGGGEIALSGSSDQPLNFAEPGPSGSYEASLGLSLTQPVLRGFACDAARIPLKRARIESEIGRLEVRKAVFDLARDVEIAYWEMVAANRALAIAASALKTSTKLVEEAAARRDAGLADRVEMIEAESARSSREESVIEARRAESDGRDQLLALLGALGRDPEPEILPASTPPPARPPVETEAEAMARIRRELPDYRIALREIDRARLDLDAARSDLLPRLDLSLSGIYRGNDGARSGAVRSARDGSDREIAAGVVLSLPLTFREERSRLKASKMQLGGREAALTRTEQDLRLQLRLARRAVETAPARIEATRSARLLAEERFQQLRARYGEGLAPLRDVLPAQDDMEQARLRELRARLDAAIAAVELARIDATILARNRIEPPEFGPRALPR